MDNQKKPFFGWRVVAAAFVIATFGWGLGFYGVPIYLHTVREVRGWSVILVSAAVTLHYLVGAIVVANLPALYKRHGLPVVTRTGSIVLAAGLVGWASAVEPWQLFAATMLTGCGWVTMGAAAINAIISPWFMTQRPKALSTAYNGASIGGVVFSPLWVFLIASIGFQAAALLIGAITIALVFWLTAAVVNKSPTELGQFADGATDDTAILVVASNAITPLPGKLVWQNWRFRTLAAAMALSLFAQIGLLAHLFSLIVPALGAQMAGLVMGLATVSAILGRTAFGWLMPVGADRRIAAALSYAIQICGALVLVASGTQSPLLIVLGIMLFGFGIGNATSLPPLIAQTEFAREDTQRVVSLIVATAQATYAFAPAFFGIVRELAIVGIFGSTIEAIPVMLASTACMALAIAALLAGRRMPT
ncbi:MAG: MFS transporter [Bosea sp. (in: a-proteobacteria)]